MTHRIQAPQARQFTQQVLARAGVPEGDASAAADVLLWASLRGVDTHGVRNLKRYYIDGLTDGTIEPRGEFRVVNETPLTAAVDGGAALGLSTAHRAMQLAIDKADRAGVGVVTVRNSHHLGAAGCYAHQAVDHDMIGACATGYFFHTGQEKSVLPFGGLVPMLSTNPLALACPSGEMPPFVLDMATSVVPVNRLELLQELGRNIPLGWAQDEQGRPTADPAEVHKLLPLGGVDQLGGHKGFGLSLAVQILVGVLSGAWQAGPDPKRVLGDGPLPGDDYAQEGVSHFCAAVRIDQFGSVDAFKAGMDALFASLNNSPAAPGHERVTLPGQREQEVLEERLQNGIPLPDVVLADLQELSQRFDLPLEVEPV